MSFGDAVETCFAKYLIFSGRASRSEYWYFVLFSELASFVGLIAAEILFVSEGIYLFRIAIVLVLSPALLSVSVRRLHDTGRSGHWLLAPFVLLVGAGFVGAYFGAIESKLIIAVFVLGSVLWFLTLFIFTLLPSNERENKFGPNPLSASSNYSDEAAKKEVNLGDFPKAQMAIEYRPDVMDAWTKTQALTVPFQRRFMEILESDPRSDPQKLAASLQEEFKKEQRPFDDEAANDALEDVRTISPSAALEFRNVYETFGDTVPLPDLFQQIEVKYGLSARTIALEGLENQRKRQKEACWTIFVGVVLYMVYLIYIYFFLTS
jgi:uncharacterized membrane protein YhaH (DUF805 family)